MAIKNKGLNKPLDTAKNSTASLFKNLFESVLLRFKPDNPSAPAGTFVFGFVILTQGSLSITVNREKAQLTNGVQNADYLVYGTYELFASILNPDFPNRAAMVAKLKMRPDYPFNNYLFSIFLNAFDLTISNLDYAAKRFDGPFPFPPRYPASDNPFRFRSYQPTLIPTYEPMLLPEIIADEHTAWKKLYDKAWSLAFKNLRQPEPTSGFIGNFIDPAFNANTFLWDSCFMTMFGGYARRVFNFMLTMDNFYAKQHDDGFICREINTYSGTDLFQSLDPRSTGPNILAWTEWWHYQHTKDRQRLQDIFPVLIAYHRWWKEWRTHRDGSYWTSGWGSGMDNQTRIPHSEYHHQHFVWIDAMLQQALSCTMLLNIANEIGDKEFDKELEIEREHLKDYVNTRMWNEEIGFYFDVSPDSTLSDTKSIGAFWGLLTDVLPQERITRMVDHLHSPKSFNRPHRIPTQSYDSPIYDPFGGYWLGGVWSPTNYMVLQGLSHQGYHDLAFEIAHNHVENVATVFQNTGTLWENYAPEHVKPGKPAGKDFVGWTGISAINIPIEYLIGVRSKRDSLVWDIRLTERHGILHYPYGLSNNLDLVCESHSSNERPIVTIRTQQSITLEIVYRSVSQYVTLEAGEHRLQI